MLATSRTQPAAQYVLRSVCRGMCVTVDWQGVIASWSAALAGLTGRRNDDVLGHFAFGALIAYDDLCVAAHDWWTFLEGGPYPQSPAHARVNVLTARGLRPATATFVTILREEAFETALFMERMGAHNAPVGSDQAAELVVREYPNLLAALRRTGTGAAPETAQDVVGTLVALELD